VTSAAPHERSVPAARGIATPIADLRGIGPVRAAALQALGVTTAGDLAALWPRRYVPLPAPAAIAGLRPGELATVRGRIAAVERSRSRRRTTGHLKVRLEDGGGSLVLVFFNQGYLQDAFARGTIVLAAGIVQGESGRLTMAPIYHRKAAEAEAVAGAFWLVDYPRVDGFKPGQLARLIADAVALCAGALDDPLPADLLERRGLASLADAVRAAHRPLGDLDVARSERRLLYDAFLARALDVETGRRERTMDALPPALRIEIPPALDREVRASLPFALTPGQETAVREIAADLGGTRPMRRLLQGDVGSGKTLVAAYAAWCAAAAGAQVAVLSPTEILARQLAEVLGAITARGGHATVLITGGLSASERRARLAATASERAAIVVGTQALLEDRVALPGLGLVIIDEQHRFGVSQRLRLVSKGASPHLLVMSATPIPRTLAMTIYGDLECSEIRDRPPGRATVETVVFRERAGREFDWRAAAERARGGAKTFIVFPAIESEEEGTPALLREGRALAVRHFRGIPVKAVHGRMSDEEKAAALEAFRRGEARVLFATTVIEVGIDVPDATEMIVTGATRFGLAQLHQLRGRVGRGSAQGRCVLIADARADREAVERLEALASSEDGFRIAERDLEVRGPGDIMGLRQHGLAARVASHDEPELLRQAFADARLLAASHADLPGLARTLARWSRQACAASPAYLNAG
jgi:ATP-dependent DNA helicase RecG